MSPCLRWYALYTKPQCERVVSQRLQAKGFETYLPPAAADPSHRPTGPQSFLPRYLFVRLDPNTNDLSLAQWTPGLKHIVSFDGRPAVVPDEVIAFIQDRLAILGHGDKATRRQGENATISLSPPFPLSLSQLRVVFEGTLKPAERAWVLVRFLDQVNKLQVAGKPAGNYSVAPAGP